MNQLSQTVSVTYRWNEIYKFIVRKTQTPHERRFPDNTYHIHAHMFYSDKQLVRFPEEGNITKPTNIHQLSQLQNESRNTTAEFHKIYKWRQEICFEFF